MWKASETSSLDARNLLIHQIDDFYKKEFKIWNGVFTHGKMLGAETQEDVDEGKICK
jgi:hypothetical protein